MERTSVWGLSFGYFIFISSTSFQVPDELEWYPYVSLFPDLLCKIGSSVSGLRKMRFNTYTPRRISTKNQFPKKPGFLSSALIILV